MLSVLASFVVGLLFGACGLALNHWFFLLFTIVVFCCFFRFFSASVYVLLIFLGLLCYQWRYEHLTAWHLPTALIKKPVEIEGRVVDLPKSMAHGVSFFFKTTRFNQKPQRSVLRLSWYRHSKPILPGQKWRFTVRLKPPVGLYNPGSFDYRQWLIHHGVRATGYIKKAFLLSNAPTYHVDDFRSRLQAFIQRSIHNQSMAALVAAITIGSHALITQEEWRVFQRTGTNHLMAISGLHIGMLAAFAFLVSGCIWRCYPRCLLWLPVQQVQAFFSLCIAICYGLLAGFALPTQRAVIMIAFLMLATLCRRDTPVWRRLLLAFCVIVILNPFSLSSASLWLSFGSVFWIAYVLSAREGKLPRWLQWCRLQWALFIGLAPFTLSYFQQLSLVAFLANALAVPYVGFIIVPCCFLTAVICPIYRPLAIVLFKMVGQLMLPLWWFLQWLSHWRFAVWLHAVSSPIVMCSTLVAALVILMPRGLPGRWLGLVMLFPLIFYPVKTPRYNHAWLTVLDVGQGLSAVVQTQHHTLLYDAGPKSYSGFDAGAAVVVPFFRVKGIHHLDMMMISHGDNDHIGGSKAVLSNMSVNTILTSVPGRFHRYATHCYDGQHWIWDGVRFNVLSPLKNQPYKDNNSSCVLWIKTSKRSFLLTGDIEKKAELALLKRHPELTSDILVAAHHGSKTSSSQAFVDQVHPKIVVFPVGAYNRFHFPSADVVKRFQSMGARLFDTGLNGAVRF